MRRLFFNFYPYKRRFRFLNNERGCYIMTERDKKVILTMRRNGVSFSAIARTFDLPVGTIKTVCSRGTKPNAEPERFCVNCGAPFQTSEHGREKRFCCRHCYNQWWHDTHDGRKAYHRTCPTCGKAFTVYSNKRQKYCSVGCFQAARKAGGEHE